MTKNSYHHGNLKETIINEVLELLNYKNFEEISFRSIARKIGVVSSAPYNHFKDKNHLIMEIILLGEKKLLNTILLEKNKSNVQNISFNTKEMIAKTLVEKISNELKANV